MDISSNQSSLKERKVVGAPLNFRGLVYSPINEQGVVYLFGLIANDLNIRVESIQQGYPDCTAIRYVGKSKWERIDIEFEYKSSNFDHDSDKCDVLVCWEDDLDDNKRHILGDLEIIELTSTIDTPEVPNNSPPQPSEGSEKAEYDLEYHFKRKEVTDNTKKLYIEFDKEIRKIDESIWVKYAQTAITYYSPEKNFVYLRFRKNSFNLNLYTKQQEISGVNNILYHDNWGIIKIKNESDLKFAVNAVKKSYELIKQAISENINTGWYAVTPKEKRWFSKEENFK